jgi:Helix-turn-helix domain
MKLPTLASISLDFPDVAGARTKHTPRERVSVREAARLLNLSPQRVGFYIRRGDLPATTINGLDYVLLRDDVLEFDRQRRSGERQTAPGRPGPEKLAELQTQRELAAQNRERLRQQMMRAEPAEG